MGSPDDALAAANDLLQSFEITAETSFDQSLLLTILGLQIHNSHKMEEIDRRIKTMAVDVSKLQASAEAAVALLEQLTGANNDPAVQAEVDAVSAQLDAAVAANTPVPPAPPA